MKLKRILILSCIVVLSLTKASSQNPATPLFQVEKYRQLFWDSLPKPASWTNDYAWLYTTEQRIYLDSIISDFNTRSGVQISIVTLDTFCVASEKFEDLAWHITKGWAIGEKSKDNGMLICISPGYHKIIICNGYGIEQNLSDAETKKIIDNIIIPEYKNMNYFRGTLEGLNEIIAKLSLHYLPSQNHSPGN